MALSASVNRIRKEGHYVEYLMKASATIYKGGMVCVADSTGLAQAAVSTAGYTVRIARNCKELVAEINAHALPDLVLLDVMLPDGNGFDMLTSIRRHPKLALLPVVMLTVLAKPQEVRRGLNLGADGYITKPYSRRVLIEIIRSVLKHS